MRSKLKKCEKRLKEFRVTEKLLKLNLRADPRKFMMVFHVIFLMSICSEGGEIFSSGDFVCEVITTNSVWIYGYTGPGGDVTIPSVVSNKTVTYVKGFKDCSTLTGVDIPETVTNIGYSAFENCESLTSVDIPDSVTFIGDTAFARCVSLTNVVMSTNVTSISPDMFAGCSKLRSICFSDSITNISMRAFINCDALTDVVIGANVTRISNWAFSSCNSIENLTISDSVTSIGEGAFKNCTSLKSIDIPDNLTSIGWDIFLGCVAVTNVHIGSNVPAISARMFQNCDALTSINIPNSVITLGVSAFEDCDALENVYIGTKLAEIGDNAFQNCGSLTNFVVESSNNSYSCQNGMLFNKSGTTLIKCGSGVASTTIPGSVLTINTKAFSYCNDLSSITMPDSITRISDYAFDACSHLISVHIPASVNKYALGKYVFRNCPALERVYFQGDCPYSFTGIFYGSTNVKFVYYCAGTSGWGETFAGYPTMPCTATTPQMIPHDWLLTNFPGLVGADDYETAANDDQDNDGMSTWEEFVAGMIPTNGSSRFDIKTVSVASNKADFAISWQSVKGRLYSVYSHTNLSIAWPTTAVYQVQGDDMSKAYTNSEPVTSIFLRLGVELYP